MKAQSIILKILMTFGILGLVISACTNKKETPKPSFYNEVALATSSSCICESDWFPHSQTTAPLEGKGSPFDVSKTTNCIFQQWAWQKFLWLTKPDTNDNPLFLNNMQQVTSNMIPVTQQTGASLILTDIKQAGPDGILKTNPAYSDSHSTSDSVYDAIYVNSTLRDASIAYGDSLMNKTLKPTNTATFPVGSLELKTSWVPVSALPADKVADYYTTTAAILQKDSSYRQEKVAMLGMHIVGVVINHPEFIWATFEHQSLAPVFDWDSKTVSSGNTLLFGEATASTINGIRWNSATDTPRTPDQVFTLYQYGVPRTSSTTYLKTSQKEPINFNNINDLNTCVAQQLSDVWVNYFHNGAIWIDTDGLTPQQQADTLVALGNKLKDSKPGAIAKGSLNAANLTMETFTQTFAHNAGDISAGNLVNCFSCHNALSATDTISPLYISHAFDGYMQYLKGKSEQTINERKLSLFMEQMAARKEQ